MRLSESGKPWKSAEAAGEYVHPARQQIPAGKRLRFAYLTRGIHGAGGVATDTAHLLWNSVVSQAEASGIHISAVVGDHTGRGLDNFMFDLIQDGEYDGILTWIGQSGPEISQGFSRFKKTPIVCLSSPLHDFPVVGINNRIGMLELMDHLIQGHKLSKLAFICGPEYHAYAVERRDAFIESLQKAGILPDPMLMSTEGEWSKQTGKEAVALFLDERGLKPGQDIEVLVCANDRIAIGVVEELELRGYRCPESVLVTGFNNLPEARSHFPAITSVAMPFREQGIAAVCLLEELVRSGRCAASLSIPSRLQVHESCSCPVFWEQVPTEQGIPAETDDLIDDVLNLQGDERLYSRFMHHYRNMGEDLLPLNSWYRQLFRAVESKLHKADSITDIHGRMQKSLKIIFGFTDISLRQRDHARMDSVLLAESLQKLDTLLALSGNVDSVVCALANEFPKFGIPFCTLVLFDGRIPLHGFPATARVAFTYPTGSLHEDISPVFKTKDVIPGGLSRIPEDSPYILIPLSFGREKLGYILFSYGLIDAHVYDSLAIKLSGALKNACLSEDLNRKAADLEESNHQLENSLQALQVAQGKLVEAEKMAALGELVAGVAHEVNTPLGAAITVCSYLQDQAGKDELVADSTRLILENLFRARALMGSFRQISVDRGSEETKRFNMQEYLRMIVDSMQPILRDGSYQVSINCPPALEINGYPGAIVQIVSNLIQNSVLHGFEHSSGGNISILVEEISGEEQPEYRIVYSDSGCGVSVEDRHKIFNPFFTTRRGSGSMGLGLHIVYNLVTQVLGGRISCEPASESGGLIFQIQAPISVI